MAESPRVGIVMLLYNRSDVAVPCLRSLVQATTEVEWELFLLDNASRPEESSAVRKEFDAFVEEGSLRGHFERSEVNTGFPRGNNIGIRYFFERDDITHLCLLNSDVLVTDHWLDRLLAVDGDAVGAVTNACGNEQTLPVESQLSPGDDNWEAVNAIARDRHARFEGYQVETDFLGFYCFLAHIELFFTVGFLDERFGRGAYEDDDYCLRILEADYSMRIARDVFLWHWGTASFSQIPPRTLRGFLARNKRLLEAKHELEWRDRSRLPLKGLWQDTEFLAGRGSEEDKALVQRFAQASTSYVDSLLAVEARASLPGKLHARYRSLRARVARRWRGTAPSRLLRFLGHMLRSKPVVVMGRWYPSGEDLRDGYFQRVLAVDRLLSDHCRIYVRTQDVPADRLVFPRLTRVGVRAFQVDVRRSNPLHSFFAALITLWSGRIYVHSVLRFGKLTKLLYRLARTRVFDIHGVVPEEFSYHADEENAAKFGELERWALERASLSVVVTRAMAEHLRSKYGSDNVPEFACLTNIPKPGSWRPRNHDTAERSGVIYCGGLHKWQQLEAMLEYVTTHADRTRFTFLVTDPEAVREAYTAAHGGEFPGELDSVPAAEVPDYYARHSFGLIFREDIVVNRAACPTKLVEYILHGVVPIVDTEAIGDFLALGYRFVRRSEELPDEPTTAEMARANLSVLRSLYGEFHREQQKLAATLGG